MRQAEPRFTARMTGLVYVLYFLMAVLGAFFTPATANAILEDESTFRVGFTLTLISTACYIALIALFYRLLEPVNRTVSLLAAFLGLVGCTLQAFGSLFLLAPLAIQRGESIASGFDGQQVLALAQVFLEIAGQADSIALVFFGLFLLLIGYLIVRSTFLPRILGTVIALAGVGWLTVLFPSLAHALLPFVEALGILAEVSLCLWLLVFGVNGERWKEQAGAASLSRYG